jgi:hypothetical protein
MANKRMFDRDLINKGIFVEMSMSAKGLYLVLGTEADDEGFISPSRVIKAHGGRKRDLQTLIDAGLIIEVGDDVVVIVDWYLNNWIDKREDRFKETVYQKEREMVELVGSKLCKGRQTGGRYEAKLRQSSATLGSSSGVSGPSSGEYNDIRWQASGELLAGEEPRDKAGSRETEEVAGQGLSSCPAVAGPVKVSLVQNSLEENRREKNRLGEVSTSASPLSGAGDNDNREASLPENLFSLSGDVIPPQPPVTKDCFGNHREDDAKCVLCSNYSRCRAASSSIS